jgi:hypothetical protein
VFDSAPVESELAQRRRSATCHAGVSRHARRKSGGTRALEQLACDEERSRADERRLHLPEQMQVVAAHGQNIRSVTFADFEVAHDPPLGP